MTMSSFPIRIGENSLAEGRLMLLDAWVRDGGHAIKEYPVYRIDGSVCPPRISLQYTLAGEGHLVRGAREYPLLPGSLMLVAAPNPYTYYAPQGKRWEFLYLTLEGKTVERLGRKAESLCGPVLQLGQRDPLLLLIQAVVQRVIEGRLPDVWENSETAYRLMMALLRRGAHLPEASRQHRIEEAIIRAVDYVEANLSEKMNVSTLAQCANMSRYHFSRIFKELIGTAPGEYIQQQRLQRAAELLQTTTLLIRDVAQVCGYSGPVHFGKSFRSRFGRSPQDFRSRSTH